MNDGDVFTYRNYTVRQWTPSDRQVVAEVIRECLESYGLRFEAEGADLDAIAVEEHYLSGGRGEFWVVVDNLSGKVVGSGGYYEVSHEPEPTAGEGGREELSGVEIRKMYLLPEARRKGLGQTLLEQLEKRVTEKGYRTVYVETATVLKEACQLYASAGYKPIEGVETKRCDQRLVKRLTSA